MSKQNATAADAVWITLPDVAAAIGRTPHDTGKLLTRFHWVPYTRRHPVTRRFDNRVLSVLQPILKQPSRPLGASHEDWFTIYTQTPGAHRAH